MPARIADRAVCIGSSRAADSYLRVDTIISVALGTDCDAVHPGYGFLCEQPELPEACVQNGLIFIGPKAEQIKRMGDKILARKIARDAGVPVIPGSGMVRDYEEAKVVARRVGYPLLLKAAAGGGGRGIVVVRGADELKASFDVAAAEALAAFGDDRLYLERYIASARHIEIQILGDRSGRVIHLGERDCSLQRRYQKILEEAPSPAVSEKLREEITAAALAIASRIRYENAGTVEFVLDLDSGQFYFMEMNTRIQVEHPVTEMVTGVDLVKEQIRIAAGSPLSLSQSDIRLTGHAIECRINAESPEAGFQPRPGRIARWFPPQSSNIRVDSHCYPGYFVPPYYDSLIAKLIVFGHDRQEAIERTKCALTGFVVDGLDTTIKFHQVLLNHPDFINGEVNTHWIEDRIIPSCA